MTTIQQYDMDANSVELIPFDWSHRVGSATITDPASFVISPSGGLTVISSTVDNTNKKVVAKVQPALASGNTVRLTNRITTSDGETLDLSLDIYITEK